MKKPRTKRASTRRLRVRVKLYPYQQRWVEDNARFKIACKARQVGFSFAAALRVVRRRQKKPGLTVWLSASERQALEAMEHIRHHVGGTKVIAEYSESFVEATSMKQHEVRLPNGSRIVALPANPDTVRGFAGDVVLDEFAFHRDAEAIWRAAFATATRGFQLEIISTPNGTRGKFYELARQAGLVDYTPSPNPFPVGQTFLSAHSAGGSAAAGAQHPFRTSESPVQRLALSEVAGLPLPGAQADAEANGFVAATGSPWSPHWVDLVTARAHGFVVDVESLRAAIADEDAWQQEYCCRFLTEAAHYIPPEMVVAAEHPAATTSLPLSATSVDPVVSDSTGRGSPVAGHLYLGVDIGRRRDLTVLWLVEVENESASPEARTYLTRAVLTLERQPFARQRQALDALLALRLSNHAALAFAVRRCALDATGLGAMLAEELQQKWGARVEPVTFTAAVKEDLAMRVKRLLEERRLKLPYDAAVRAALGAVKRYVTPAGNIRFDADRTDRAGHADHFWALALALAAAEEPQISVDFISTAQRRPFSQAYVF